MLRIVLRASHEFGSLILKATSLGRYEHHPSFIQEETEAGERAQGHTDRRDGAGFGLGYSTPQLWGPQRRAGSNSFLVISLLSTFKDFLFVLGFTIKYLGMEFLFYLSHLTFGRIFRSGNS